MNEGSNVESVSEEEDDESEFKQKPALPFEEVDENHEDYQAFQYLMTVRNQANSIKEKYKPKIQYSVGVKETEEQKDMVDEGIQEKCEKEWRKDVMKNWHCVIENIKHLRKEKIQPPETKIAINYQNQPKVYELVHIPLGKIEKLLKQICTLFHQGKREHNFYLWIYSLLALHQSSSPYKIFQQLADLNSFVLADHQGKEVECKVLKAILKEHFCQKHLNS